MSKLKVRKFGQSDMPTEFGLGGAVLNNSSYEDGVATVKRALELGVTYFDTSPGYCRNLSQPIMGEGLAGAGDGIMIATKVGYFPTADGFRSPTAIKDQIKDNLRLLGRSSVDVLQVHETNWVGWWEDGVADPHADVDITVERDWNHAPVLEALREAKQEGLCRYIGITGNRAPIMSHILDNVEVDTFLLAYSYDPIIRNAEDSALEIVARKGTTLILGAIFYGGRLVAVHPEWIADPPEWMDSELKGRFEKLYAIQQDCGISLVQLSVRFAMAREEPSVVLVGAAKPSELEESIQAVHDGPLPPDLQAAIESLGVHGRS
jgi:aryl-alcohol dehydrogenase-like predicted oxidoreductase